MSTCLTTNTEHGATLKDVQDFLSEAWITKSCNHDNVIRLLNLTFCDGLPYLLFPFYKNGDLASYIKNNELVGLLRYKCT